MVSLPEKQLHVGQFDALLALHVLLVHDLDEKRAGNLVNDLPDAAGQGKLAKFQCLMEHGRAALFTETLANGWIAGK